MKGSQIWRLGEGGVRLNQLTRIFAKMELCKDEHRSLKSGRG